MHHAETLIKDERVVKIEKEKARVALKNCGYPDWALKEGEPLRKREKRREEEMQGQDGENRLENPRKPLWYCRILGGLQRGWKEPSNNTTYSSSATPGTPFEMLLYTRRTLWTQGENVVLYMSPSVRSVVSCMYLRWRDL